jgi:RND family efflux transporter MFP subunit
MGALGLGLVAMLGLGLLYDEPEVSTPPAPILRAPAIQVYPEDFQTILRGLGTARARVILDVRPEIGGRVESLHPRLETGMVVPAGDVLFTIEQEDFKARLAEAEAEVLRLEAQLNGLRREEENDRRRLAVQIEQRDLAEKEFERISSLFRDGGAESQARLDQARGNALQREDAVVALENSLALYESRIQIANAQLMTANARRSTAQRDLERTQVRAPFDGRIAMKDLEAGKYVAAGQTVLQLANDADLEIPVSLESAEVSRWLDVEANPMDIHWFGAMDDHLVKVRWVEQPEGLSYVGTLERVETYDPRTRTFVFIVKVNRETQSRGGDSSPQFPLTDGMFCEVEVPGRMAEDVYVVPREAVDSQGNLLVVRDGKLKTVAVEIARKQDKVALIRSGLEPGETVIISRPPNVLDGTTVEATLVPFEANGGMSL